MSENLHIYGQQAWHDNIAIIGTPKMLTGLTDLISSALIDRYFLNGEEKELGVAESTHKDLSLFTSDGEGYRLSVVALPENDKRWDKLAMPYHDPDQYQIQEGDLYWVPNVGFQEYKPGNHQAPVSLEAKIAKWLLTGDTGSSSKTMASIAMGVDYENTNVPRDIGDLGRCYQLVKVAPEIIHRILMLNPSEVSYKRFLPFIWQWGQLSKMYETYLAQGKDRNSENAVLLSMFLTVLCDCDGDLQKSENALIVAKEKVQSKKEQEALLAAQRKKAEEETKAEYDALPAIKKRPKLNDSVIRMGAQIFVEEHFKNGDNWLEGCVDDFIEEIITEWNHDDGFEIGQKLNSNGWDLGRNEFEDLDYLSSCIEQAHKKLVKQWIEDNQITPPYPIGTHVKFDHTKKGLTGVIKEDGVGSRHYVGQYAIEVDAIHNYGNGYPIVNWEDVEPTSLHTLEPSDPLKEMVVSVLQDASIELPIESHKH